MTRAEFIEKLKKDLGEEEFPFTIGLVTKLLKSKLPHEISNDLYPVIKMIGIQVEMALKELDDQLCQVMECYNDHFKNLFERLKKLEGSNE